MNIQKTCRYLFNTILIINSCNNPQNAENSKVNAEISSAILSGQRVTFGFEEKDSSDLRRLSSECFWGPYQFSWNTNLDDEYADNYTFDNKQYFSICMAWGLSYPSNFVGLVSDFDGVKGPMWVSPDPTKPATISANMSTKIFSKNDLQSLQGLKFTLNAKISIRVKYPNKQQFDDPPGVYRRELKGINVAAELRCEGDIVDKEGDTNNATEIKRVGFHDEAYFDQDEWKDIELLFSKSQVDLSKCRSGLFLKHSVNSGGGYHYKASEIQVLVEK